MKIYQHLGLGDHIICNGLIRKIAGHREFSIFAKPHNVESVEFMFRDLHCKVIPADDADARAQLIASDIIIGHGHGPKGETFEKGFYGQFGVDFSEKWESFYLERDGDREASLAKGIEAGYKFVHSDDSRGMSIKIEGENFYLPSPETTGNIFDYLGVIENAEEIHVIDSCFMFLIDCALPDLKVPKYIHRYARENNDWHLPELRGGWEILN